MKPFWIGIGCALSLVATTATAFACGPPMDTLCGIVHSIEEADLGTDMVGLILHGPFAFGTIDCSCEGTTEEVAVTDMVDVHLYCDADDAVCLEGMEEAISGSFDGQFALFTTLFPWTKMKGGGGFPSFVDAQSSSLETVEVWNFQIAQALVPSFAVQNRICRAASEMEVPEPPVPLVSDSLIPSQSFELSNDQIVSMDGNLRTADPVVPPTSESEEGSDPDTSDKLPGTDPEIPDDEPGNSPEEILPALEGELPPAGCSAARGEIPASGWVGLAWMLAMGALLRRRGSRPVPIS